MRALSWYVFALAIIFVDADPAVRGRAANEPANNDCEGRECFVGSISR